MFSGHRTFQLELRFPMFSLKQRSIRQPREDQEVTHQTIWSDSIERRAEREQHLASGAVLHHLGRPEAHPSNSASILHKPWCLPCDPFVASPRGFFHVTHVAIRQPKQDT